MLRLGKEKSSHTVKILLEAQAFIRIIIFGGDGSGCLLEATSARKVIKAILKMLLVSLSLFQD